MRLNKAHRAERNIKIKPIDYNVINKNEKKSHAFTTKTLCFC
jgi:hypothetical protein